VAICCCTGAKARIDGDSDWELLPFREDANTLGSFSVANDRRVRPQWCAQCVVLALRPGITAIDLAGKAVGSKYYGYLSDLQSFKPRVRCPIVTLFAQVREPGHACGTARALGIGLLSGGYGQEELERAGAFGVYEDPADLLRHIDEVVARSLLSKACP